MTRESLCLLLIAPGVLAVSLSYGLYPEITLKYLYDIEVNSANLANIFRIPGPTLLKSTSLPPTLTVFPPPD